MMQPAWFDAEEFQRVPRGIGFWVRVPARGTALAILVFGCLLVLMFVRLIERPIFGPSRPVTPFITRFVCRNAFRVLGIGFSVSGRPMTGSGAAVANHASWLDIFALNACKNVYFVSKAEVAAWFGIGWLARATGTIFIRRDRREAKAQVALFRDRLVLGHRLLFFPEGTSTDGRRVLPFKPTLFAAFFDDALRDTMKIQAVSVAYHAAKGRDRRQYGWWGEMSFGPHLVDILGAKPQGRVVLRYHPEMCVADFADRKSLAAALEKKVREGLEAEGVLDR